MSDLISRQAAVDVAQKTIENPRVLDRVMLKLYELPSAQPSTQLIAEIKVSKEDMEELLAEKVEAIKAELVQPKTGKWESIEDVIWYCSECKYAHSRSNYCPHCGAKMEAEVKESEP